jgi:hypothetical protein
LLNEQREPKVSGDENNCENKGGSHQGEEVLHDTVQDINITGESSAKKATHAKISGRKLLGHFRNE